MGFEPTILPRWKRGAIPDSAHSHKNSRAISPPADGPEASIIRPIKLQHGKMERRTDPETASPAWEAGILPLN